MGDLIKVLLVGWILKRIFPALLVVGLIVALLVL